MRRATLCVGLMALSMFISADTVIRDARGIDGTGAAPQESTSIWVKDGYIKEIGTELQVTDATRVFDARDMTIIPGLIDSHVHLFSLPGATFRNDSEAEGRRHRGQVVPESRQYAGRGLALRYAPGSACERTWQPGQ